MGRKKVFDGKLVSIGAKVTERQMNEINDLVTKLGMKSRSDLFRAALEDYLLDRSHDYSYNDGITDARTTEAPQGGLRGYKAYKELENSLNNALTELKSLDECSRLDTLMPCSNDECLKIEVIKDN